MGHKHSVHDTDARFLINAITRVIKNDSPKKIILIQHDHKSERFTFECPRYIEGHDLSLCNVVEVHYLNAGIGTKAEKKGLCVLDDLQVSPEDESKVVCSWLVSRNATQLVGSLNFIIRFCCKENGLIEYAWNTAVCSDVSVSTGIDASEDFETDYVDVIEQWKDSVMQTFRDDIAMWKARTKSDIDSSIEDWKNEATEEVDANFNSHSTEWNQKLAVERARIDQFTKLKEGSTTGDAELIDARIDTSGTVHKNLGESIRTQMNAKQDLFAVFKEIEAEVVHDTVYNVNTHETMSLAYGEYIDYTLNGEKILKISGFSHSSSDSFAMATFFDADNNVLSKVGSTTPNTAYEDFHVLVPNGATRLVLNGKRWSGDVCIKNCIPKDLNELDIRANNIMPEQFNACVNMASTILTKVLAPDNTELLESVLYNGIGELETGAITETSIYDTIIYPITGIWMYVDLSNYPVGTHGGAFLDAEKNWISSFSTTTANEVYKELKPVPVNAKYIAITKLSTTTYKEIYVHSVEYEFEGLKVQESNVVYNDVVDTTLKNKKIVWLGTSVSFGANAETSYPYEASKKMAFELVNCSVPGIAIHTNADGSMKQYGSLVLSKAEYVKQGWTIPDAPIEYTPGGSHNNYYRTYENVFCAENADADLYVFDVVPNNSDFSLSDWNAFDFSNWCYKDGSTFEEHRTTFLGALLFLMDKMYAINENARMVFVLGSGFAYWEGKTAFKTVKDKWNIPVIDLWGKINTSPKSLIKLRSLDGTDPHPSTLAHEIMGRMLLHDLPGVY